MSEKKKSGIGHIYRRKVKDPVTGKVRTLPTWWLQFGHEGRDIRESSKSHNQRTAESLLRKRIAEIEQGTFAPRADRLTVEDLAKAIETNYRVKGRRSIERLETSLKHLRAHLAFVKATRMAERVPAYVAARMEEGASTASIRLELLVLGKALKLLGLRHVAERMREHVPATDPSKRRRGFVTREQLETLLATLHPDIRPIVGFGFYTALRSRELTGLSWAAVDREAGEFRIRSEETKNEEPRSVPYRAVPALEGIVETQWERAQDVLRRTGRFPERVFFRLRNGAPIRDFRTAWKNGCTRAGYPALIFHDIRRSAARIMTRSGIPERVAMRIGGWKTRSVFDNYAISSLEDVREEMGKLADAGPLRERAPRRATATTHDESA